MSKKPWRVSDLPLNLDLTPPPISRPSRQGNRYLNLAVGAIRDWLDQISIPARSVEISLKIGDRFYHPAIHAFQAFAEGRENIRHFPHCTDVRIEGMTLSFTEREQDRFNRLEDDIRAAHNYLEIVEKRNQGLSQEIEATEQWFFELKEELGYPPTASIQQVIKDLREKAGV